MATGIRHHLDLVGIIHEKAEHIHEVSAHGSKGGHFMVPAHITQLLDDVLHKLPSQMGVVTRAQVLEAAIATLHWAVDHLAQGHEILVEPNHGNVQHDKEVWQSIH